MSKSYLKVNLIENKVIYQWKAYDARKQKIIFFICLTYQARHNLHAKIGYWHPPKLQNEIVQIGRFR